MKGNNIRIVLQYDGTRYDGWQKQGNTDRTIQGRLERILERMTGQTVEVHGSGRTDAGVHALRQTANFHLPANARGKDWEPEAVRDALNRHLPEDIAVLEAERVPERFHSRLNAVSKTYLYRIETAERADVFQRKYVYILGKPLDAGAMERAAFFLAGTHDFRGFSSLKRTRKSTVRTLALPEIRTAGSGMELLFTGDGFLYHMVRIMAGTLIEAGLHERSAESVKEVLESKNRALAGFTAPPQGLFLADVRYSSDRV
ncbi:MAG: tRNA pseudouridine(38-40) synthase TruA [Clostridium sp.]|nr:tRNA pseudouridine(38-40) synthase TruA [Clostridium sp.]